MSGGLTPVPMVLRTAVGGGLQVGAQHSQMLEAWLTHVPGLKVVVPSTPSDARGLLASCIADDDPCVFIEQVLLLSRKGAVGDEPVPLGVADVKRPGADVTVVTYGRQVHEAIAVADTLASRGVEVEVLDLRSLVPLDEAAVLESVGRTRRAVVLHEAVVTGGLRCRAGGGDLRGPLRAAGGARPAGGRACRPRCPTPATSSASPSPVPNDCSRRSSGSWPTRPEPPVLLRLPKIGMEMTEAVLARWLVDDGATVAKGQPLYEMETDKVTNEIESPASGRLRRVALEGETYQVGDPVAEID